MQFTSSYLMLLGAFASLVIAAPSPQPIPGPDIEARAAEVSGHLYICTEGGFSGDCDNYGFNVNQCTNFPSAFDNQISSMGPDSGWFCITFVNYNCDYSGYTYTVTSPGYSSLPSGIDNALSSIICYKSS